MIKIYNVILIAFSILCVATNLYASNLKYEKLDQLNIKLIHSTRRTGAPVDYLLYTGDNRDKNDLVKIVNEVKKISENFYLYDDLNVLELEWLTWGAALAGMEYYTKIDELSKKCKCALENHFVSANYLQTKDGLALSYLKDKNCSPCNISKDIEELKLLSEQLLKGN